MQGVTALVFLTVRECDAHTFIIYELFLFKDAVLVYRTMNTQTVYVLKIIPLTVIWFSSMLGSVVFIFV